MEIWQNILISLFGSSGVAWIVAKLLIKDIARKTINEKLGDLEKIYTTKEQMQIERKDLLEEVRKQYLSIMAFREVEKRFEENFKTIDRRLSDTSKRFDKVDASLEHITDLLIKKH